MTTDAQGTLAERLAAFAGTAFRPPTKARDPVNLPMIRHLTDALGDANPVYTDEAFAGSSVHGGIVAPPTSLQVWTLPGLARRDGDDARPALMSLLDEEGFVGVVATDCEQTYHRYLRPGDVLTLTTEIDAIVGPKQTALGEGFFVTTVETYTAQDGEVVGEMRFRILKFRPNNKQPSTTDRPPPPLDSAFFWEGIEVDELRIQRCASCGALRHPPRPACPVCTSFDADHIVAEGRGEVYSYVVHHRPQVPGREHPFAVAVVQLEEGTRIVGNVIDCPPNDVTIGMPVEVVFTEERGRKLPQWRPR